MKKRMWVLVFCMAGIAAIAGLEPSFSGAPTNVVGANGGAGEGYPSLSGDGLSLYFVTTRAGSDDIWVATRPDINSDFGPAAPVAELNSGGAENSPSISADGLSMYFNTNQFGHADIYVSTRASTSHPFGAPLPVPGGVNSSSVDAEPFISKDGLTLLFESDRSGNFDLWAATRPDATSPFSAAFVLSELNSMHYDGAPTMTADGLTIIFHSLRPGGSGGHDLWTSARSNTQSSFGTPVPLSSVNTFASEASPDVSADGCLLLFTSDRAGGQGPDIWVVKSASPMCLVLPTVALIIDEDSIDNGTKSIESISFNAPFCGAGNPAVCVNDDIANPGVRTPLFSRPPAYAVPAGTSFMLATGQIGDEGLFRFGNADPQRSEQNGATFTTQEFFAASGAAADENNLDKVSNVVPLREADIMRLRGQVICAVVYDSDISSNANPPYGNLKGAALGITAFRVTSVDPNPNGGSYLPLITVELLAPDTVPASCQSPGSLQ